MPDNVAIFPPRFEPNRVSEQISFEEFCIADAGEEWLDRTRLDNGIIILQYPRLVMVCCPNNCCTVIRQAGADFQGYINEALAELERLERVA